MTYQKLEWEAKEIRSTFWGYFAFPVLLLDVSFRWKSELIKFLQVSRISSTILTSSCILLLGKNVSICFWMEINSSLAIILGLRFSIYMKRESLFTYMPFTTYLLHISFPCILKDTCIWSRCVHTEQYTSLRSYTGAWNTESARLCDIKCKCQ